MDQLQQSIIGAKILPEGTKVTCTRSGAELLTSTYNPDNGSEHDCKINAVLIAKTVFEKDKDLARTTVQFYEVRQPGCYLEVTVTVGDVAAFGAGTVSQNQLLSALKVTRHAPDPTFRNGSQKKPLNIDDVVATTNQQQPKPGAVKPEEKTRSYTNYGVTIKYPPQWQAEYPKKGNTIIRLMAPSASMIVMHAYSTQVRPADLIKSDPRDIFSEERDALWLQLVPSMAKENIASWHAEDSQAYQRFMRRSDGLSAYNEWKSARRNQTSTLLPVTLPARVTIGKGSPTNGVQRGCYIEEIGFGAKNYCRIVAFTSGNATMLLGLFAPELSAPTANRLFEDLLSHTTLSATPGKAPK
ncbi:MAG: hypothetical protein JST89_01915 [Cyanobacteria bacterium SZAS-4]|nr:hypothetical protein [Cyanobacteria bacterium SZAS-4]